MALPGHPSPVKTSPRRTWAGVVAAAVVLAGLGYIVERNHRGSIPLYQLSTATLGPTPSSWPEDHRSMVNNDSFQVATYSHGPHYLTELPSLANSDSPVVNNLLYVTGGLGSSGHPGYLWALNPRNGKLIWSETLANAVFSEPIVAHNRVFVSEGNAVFSGTSSSPSTTVGSKRGTGPSGVYAYNANTGAALWNFATDYAVQAPVTVLHGRVYAATGGRHLYVLSAKTGQLQWRARIDVYVSRSSPRIIGPRIYFGGAGPLQVVALSAKSHHIVWKRPIPRATGGVDDTPLVYSHGILYTASLAGKTGIIRTNPHHFAKIYAISAKTGKILWNRTLAEGKNPPYKETGTPMLHDGRVFVGNALNGSFTALKAKTGAVLWSDNLHTPVTRPAVFVDGRVLVLTSHGVLYSLSPKTGAVLKQTRVATWVNAYGPVLINQTVFVTGNTDKHGYLAAIPLKMVLGKTTP